MKKQNFLKSAFCLLLGLVCHVAWAQSTATIEVSTSVDAPENMYEIKSSAGHWMTSFTSPSGTIRGCFAFFDDGDANTTDAYKIYSATHRQWVSYTKAASYSGGVNKVVLVDSQEDANAWNATTELLMKRSIISLLLIRTAGLLPLCIGTGMVVPALIPTTT